MSELALDWTQIWPVVRDISSWILFLLGSAAVVTGAIGVIRFPDFYSRMHAAGITDYTLSLHDALPIIGRASCRERV